MITFDRPKELNGKQLRDELNANGVKISDDAQSVCDDGQGNLLLEIKSSDEAKAAAVVSAHMGIDNSINYAAAKASAQTKLAALGLTADEVAAIVGN